MMTLAEVAILRGEADPAPACDPGAGENQAADGRRIGRSVEPQARPA